MKVVDLHPEDLLDKDANGKLTETERERLDAHLARCATCRFEREVKADFATELEEEEELSSQRLVALALLSETTAGASHTSHADADKNTQREEEREGRGEERGDRGEELIPTPLSSRSSSRRRTVRVVLLVAAALMVGSVATAGAGSRVWASIASVWSEPPTELAPVTPTAPSSGSMPPHVSVGASAVVPQRTPPELRDEDSEPSNAIIRPVAMTATSAAALAPPPPPSNEMSAANLFDAANEARRQGDYARAITLHRRLQQTHPSSREAHASHGTVGRLLLDRGDAASALASFDAYQARGSGPLDEPVMVGRATALERLGRADEARRAWIALLATFPETPYAEHARTRIQATQGSAPSPSPSPPRSSVR